MLGTRHRLFGGPRVIRDDAIRTRSRGIHEERFPLLLADDGDFGIHWHAAHDVPPEEQAIEFLHLCHANDGHSHFNCLELFSDQSADATKVQ